MAQVRIDFSKIAAPDLSAQARSRATSQPSTHDFASMLDAGDAGTTPPAPADTPVRTSRCAERPSSRRTDSPPPPAQTTSARERADAAPEVKDNGSTRTTDRTADATAKDGGGARKAADTDENAGVADSGPGDGADTDHDVATTAATVAPPEMLLAAVAPLGQSDAQVPAGPTADDTGSVDAAMVTEPTRPGVPSATTDIPRGDTGATEGRTAAAPLLMALVQQKPGGDTAAADNEAASPEATDAEAAPETPSSADEPAKGDKLRSAGAASVATPAGERPAADEQQAQPLPPADASDGPKARFAAEPSPAGAKAHQDLDGTAVTPDKKEARDDGEAVRTNEPRFGAIQAAASANPESSATAVGAQAGLGGVGRASASATAAPAATRADTASTAVPLADIGVAIAAQAKAGRHSFDIRLDPPDLGHIHVRLDVDRDGTVVSRLVVDRAETLDLLRRDAPQLERALQDAGLKADAQTMQFSLRQQNTGQQEGQNARHSATPIADVDAAASRDERPSSYGRLSSRTGGLDIRI